MRNAFRFILPLLILSLLLCGCDILGLVSAPEIPDFGGSLSTLAGTVEYVNGRTCRVLITEEDSHFDEDDIIQVTYTSLEGNKSVRIGDTVRITYDYVSQVSELAGDPHITVNQMIVE